ncbi:radical SAM protein [Candidatus Methylomirabilis lanthanidiphila]|uniref:Radical SAM protein n=1 Tax=Candidatus Methylomirabilis lanthanidiphila TaxID=2211376 RepID=A0A564ZH35_9BACT|nr:radical SAM protein [Candidatus Methylomirabilis lanthanidiphila]VUZ84604.1 radical SAM protein [Candidatus Methylomirabilis lanthanidiphila]
MKHVFGPVPSRRLGQSLGIDPIPFKTCNWNCVYCQLGRSTPMTNERRDYVPREEIIAEVKDALAAHRPGEIDWITFVGSGEPTLHAGLGMMIRHVKTLTEIPVAVITNGSLLYRHDVREELTAADAVLPTLDAGTESLYRRINRPWPDLTFERLVDGLIAFRQRFSGKLWIEVMLIKGVNDTEMALTDLAAVLRRIGPDEVHINLPIRPPAESWVAPPDREGLARASALLGEIAHVLIPAEGAFDLSGHDNVVDAVVGVIIRHPIPEDDLIKTLDRWTRGQVERALADLAAGGRAQVVTRYGKRFWSYVGARYA